jgi:hypothetical protein
VAGDKSAVLWMKFPSILQAAIEEGSKFFDLHKTGVSWKWIPSLAFMLIKENPLQG